jgi:SnoaL-like polyketide cyclase
LESIKRSSDNSSQIKHIAKAPEVYTHKSVLMKTLDDAWNSQDWDTFEERHADDVKVYWPGQPEPTRGLHNHSKESIEFFRIFPDNHLVNNPYKILFSKDDYTCSVADFTGTFKGHC